MFFVVPTEETRVGEVVIPRYLLDALGSALQLHLDLQYDVLVDYCLGRVVGHLPHDGGEVLGRDIHLCGVVVHIARQFVVALHKHHEKVEELAHTVRLHLIGTVLRIALQILMETYEESLELAKHQLRYAGAVGLVEIYSQQRKHAVDDACHDGRVLTATILTKGGVDGLLQLKACLTQE